MPVEYFSAWRQKTLVGAVETVLDDVWARVRVTDRQLRQTYIKMRLVHLRPLGHSKER